MVVKASQPARKNPSVGARAEAKPVVVQVSAAEARLSDYLSDEEVERDRQGMRDTMKRLDLVPNTWARAAGFRNANALYNWLSGRTRSLSLDVRERLAAVLPGETAWSIIGRKPPRARKNAVDAVMRQVPIRTAARASLWRRVYELPKRERGSILAVAMPDNDMDIAVRIDDDSINELYSAGSYALVHSLRPQDRLRNGDVVLVERRRVRAEAETVEITLRQVVVTKQGAVLRWRSLNPDFQGDVPMPWPYEGGKPFTNLQEPKFAIHKRSVYRITGVVVTVQTMARRILNG